MRREGRKALLDALLIADVGKNGRENAHGAAVVAGDVQPALRHQAEKAQRLEAHRLAAGVGAGDDERIKAAAQLNVDGHGLRRVEQRVARMAQVNAAVLFDLRAHGVHLVAQLAAREDEVFIK